MSSIYNGSNVFPSGYTIPDDGDAQTAASVNVAFEALGDRTIHTKLRVDSLERSKNNIIANWLLADRVVVTSPPLVLALTKGSTDTATATLVASGISHACGRPRRSGA